LNEWIQRRSSADTKADTQTGSTRGFNSTSIDSQFQRDRARIIHSASFRALQSKTQVLGLGESDFYRTRLTHSLEVAQIGSGICEWLRNSPTSKINNEISEWIPSLSLIEAACLAHDIGHSPFGHGGEVALNFMMKDHGGFEANGQTLRILSKLGEYSPASGLDLTRRTQLGTIKYPVFYSDVVNYAENPTGSGGNQIQAQTPRTLHPNIDHWSPPKCIYDSDRSTLEWILQPFTGRDKQQFLSIKQSPKGHGRSQFKSFDTSIMELADDIAYGVHDLEDALALGLVDFENWCTQVSELLANLPHNPIADEIDFYNRELFSNDNRGRKHAISKLVGYLIRSIRVEERSEFEHPILRYQASMEDVAYQVLKCLKRFVMDEVIMRPELQALQFKGQQVIISLFEIFSDNPERLLPAKVYQQYMAGGDEDSATFAADSAGTADNGSQVLYNRRAISDFICSMTDVSAGKLYHKLLTPTSGSIFDRT